MRLAKEARRIRGLRIGCSGVAGSKFNVRKFKAHGFKVRGFEGWSLELSNLRTLNRLPGYRNCTERAEVYGILPADCAGVVVLAMKAEWHGRAVVGDRC